MVFQCNNSLLLQTFLHTEPLLEVLSDLKKQDLGINPYVANNGSRDQSLTGIGGPGVTLIALALYYTGPILHLPYITPAHNTPVHITLIHITLVYITPVYYSPPST